MRSVVVLPTRRRRRFGVVVLVDGLDAVRSGLDDAGTAAEFDMLDTILTLGPAHDVVVVCTFDRAASIPSTVLARCAQRWVFHLTDPLDASVLGVAPADVPAAQPGRIIVASTQLEAQLMVGSLPLPSCVDGAVPLAVECLRADVAATDLPHAASVG